ncbi:methyltransferase domain-containing protein, partial [Candidatus Saccharibacteria bacterium]|nr:methyltransferase domain-containing protein [Candidatus Saccharibacteria bacterium]
IRLGKPSYLWRAGQRRRLDLVKKHIPLEKKKILDVGCGVGTYLKAFKQFSSDLYGTEIDPQRAKEAKKITPRIFLASAEKLPFPNGT